MKTTWHFTIPDQLRASSIQKLAIDSNLIAFQEKTLNELQVLFDTLCAYEKLPLGLTHEHSQRLRKQIQQLKEERPTSCEKLQRLIREIENTRLEYKSRISLAEKEDLPIYTSYSHEALYFLINTLFSSIENYLENAERELKNIRNKKRKNQASKEFGAFITSLKNTLKSHESSLAQSLALRLQEYDQSQSIDGLNENHFKQYHSFALKHGDPQTQSILKNLSWIQQDPSILENLRLTQPTQGPRWLFKGRYANYDAFKNVYHHTQINLQIKKSLSSSSKHNPDLEDLRTSKHAIQNEIKRLHRLEKNLSSIFQKQTKNKIKKRLDYLKKSLSSIQEALSSEEEKEKIRQSFEDKKQSRRDLILSRKKEAHAQSINEFRNSLVSRIYNSRPAEHKQIHDIVKNFQDDLIEKIWQQHLEQYRLTLFQQIITNPKNASLANEFKASINSINLRFPCTEQTHQHLIILAEVAPTNTWTSVQHNCCELIQSHLFLEIYYANALLHPNTKQAVIQKFLDPSYLEIEYASLAPNVKAALNESSASKNIIKIEKPTTEIEPIKSTVASNLLLELRTLLSRETLLESYIDALKDIKNRANKLPNSSEFLKIKRLCTAGAYIKQFLTELTVSLLAFANGEISFIPQINEFLFEILSENLTPPQNQKQLCQLTEAIIAQDSLSLPLTELKRIETVERCLKGDFQEGDIAYFISSDFQVNNRNRITNMPTPTSTNHGNNNDKTKAASAT